MTERLKFEGRITATVTTPDGEVVGEWSSKNTACTAGLGALVSAIAYAGVEDIAGSISALPSIITPIYGAIGGPSASVIVNSSTTSGSYTITPQVAGTFSSTLVGTTVTDADNFIPSSPSPTTVLSVASDGSSIVLSAPPTTTTSSDLLTFTSSAVNTSISCALDSTTTTITPTVAGAFSGVASGAVVSGTGIPTSAVVTVVGTDFSYVQINPLNSALWPTVTSSSNALTFSPPGPVVVNCNVTSGSPLVPGAGAPTAPFTGVGIGWTAIDAEGIVTGSSVVAVSPSGTSVTVYPSPGSSYTSDSVVFSPAAPASTDAALYNEFATGIGRTTASAAGSAPATSGTNATFTWQFQFPINNTSSTISVSEAGVFLLGDAGAGDGSLLNHALLNPAAQWSPGTMLTLSITIGISP